MERTAGSFHLPACTDQRGIGVEASVSDGRRDAYQILHHDAASAEIEVADFAVAHLPFGQIDAQPGRLEQGPRAPRPYGIPGRSGCECDCVAGSFGAITPAIEYDQRDWPRAR